MLQKLRDQTQGTGFKVLAGAIILVLVLFGFGASNLLPSTDPEVASIGNSEITQSVLDDAVERERRRLLGQMGVDFDPSSIDRLQLQSYVLEQMISRSVLYQAADELGVQVSRAQTDSELVNNQAYQVDGRFDEGLYRQRLQSIGYNPVDFREEVASALGSDQLRLGLTTSVFVADWELAESIRVITQKRDLAYLPLQIDHFSSRVEVSDDEIAVRFEENQSSYMTQLSVDVEYVSISLDDLVNDASIEIDEKGLEEIYAEDKASFSLGDQRDSSHILVQINNQRDEAAALELITEVKAKLAEGAAFEDLVEEFSEDSGSRAQEGSLGPASKGIFDPAFETALWALEETGLISDPIKSSFGYHLIRLDDVMVQEYPSFSERRADVELRVRRTRAQDLLSERSVLLERSAYDEGFSLNETASKFGLEVQSASGVNRTQQPGHELLLGNTAVLDVLFSDEALGGENSPMLEVGDAVLVARVADRHEPEPIPLTEVATAIKDTLIREKALVAIEEAKADAFERLQAGEGVTDIAQYYDLRWTTHEAVTRSDRGSIPPAVLALAFELPRPPTDKKSVGETTLPDGAALVTVTRVQQGNVNLTTDAEAAQLEQGLTNRTSQISFGSFFRAAEEELGVSRLLATSQTDE